MSGFKWTMLKNLKDVTQRAKWSDKCSEKQTMNLSYGLKKLVNLFTGNDSEAWCRSTFKLNDPCGSNVSDKELNHLRGCEAGIKALSDVLSKYSQVKGVALQMRWDILDACSSSGMKMRKTFKNVSPKAISASRKRSASSAGLSDDEHVPKKPRGGGRKPYFTPDGESKKEAKLRSYLESVTKESANRKVKSPGGTIHNAREYVEPLDDVVSQWSPVTRRDVRKTTVKKKIKAMRIYKRRNEITGMCPLCNRHPLVASEANRLSGDEWDFPLHHITSYYPDESEWKEVVESSKHKRFAELMDDLKTLDEHLKHRNEDRLYQQKRRENFPWDLGVLTADFKQPIVRGKRPVGLEDDPFNYSSATCLGIVFERRCNIRPDKKVLPSTERIYVDMISANRDHSSFAARKHLMAGIRKKEIREAILKKTKLEVRVDNASHFISNEFATAVLIDIHKEYPHLIEITYCPFPPRHGKSDCDRHFQKVSMWTARFSKKEKFASIPSVVKAINQGAQNSNAQRERDGKKPIVTKAYRSTLRDPKGSSYKKLIIPQIQSTHGVTMHYKKISGSKFDMQLINHVFPWRHRSKGIELSTNFTTMKYYKGLHDKYAEPEEPEISIDHLRKQIQNREQMDKTIYKS